MGNFFQIPKQDTPNTPSADEGKEVLVPSAIQASGSDVSSGQRSLDEHEESFKKIAVRLAEIGDDIPKKDYWYFKLLAAVRGEIPGPSQGKIGLLAEESRSRLPNSASSGASAASESVTPYEWFLHTLSAHLTATAPENLCDYFNILNEEKSSITSSRNPGLSLLMALDEKGVIKSSDVTSLRTPLTAFKLVQAAAKVEEYDMQIKESGMHFPMMSNLDLKGKRKLFIQCLKQKIKSWYETMTPVPWKKSCKWKAADLFVGSGLILTDYKSKVDPTDIDSTCRLQYDDLFTHKSLELESRLVLEGEPGSGKTMLASQLAYDWSQSKFSNVELLVFLPLKFVGAMTLAKAMKEFYISDHIALTEKDLDEILEEGNLETCIILDGLEEYNPKVTEEEGKPEVHKVMSKNKYSTCKVIITARSDYAQDLPACKMLKVGRFGETERNTYIEKVFPDDEENQKQIQRVINESRFLLDMCSVPLLFVLLIHNFESIDKYKDEKLEKVTPFMMSMDDTLCEQIGGSEEFGNSRNAKNRSALQELAFAGLCRGSQKLWWQRDDVEEIVDNVNEWIDAGILIMEDDISVKVKGELEPEEELVPLEPEERLVPFAGEFIPQGGRKGEKGKAKSQVQSSQQSHSVESGLRHKSSRSTAKLVPSRLKFLHKLFQEWFAAKHLSSEIWSSKKESFSDVLNSIDPMDLHYILRFTCYLCPPSCHLILSHLMKKYHKSTDGQKEPIMDCICLCFAEYNEPKGHDIKVIVKDICNETIIIQSQDSRLLQYSKTGLLKFASQCQIPIMSLELRDVVTAVQGKILTLKQDVSIEVVDSLRYINVSRWDNKLGEQKSNSIVDLIASSHSVKHAVLEFPYPPPKVDEKVLLKVSSKNMKIEWKVGQMVFMLHPQSGEWEMSFKGHGSSNRDMSPLDPNPDSESSGKYTTEQYHKHHWFAEKYVDSKGGRLDIGETDISLEIPPNALKSAVKIRISIVDYPDTPLLPGGDLPIVTSVVCCDPCGLTFHQPVKLSLPHCCLIGPNEDTKVVCYRGTYESGSTLKWTKQEGMVTLLSEDTCCLLINHFSKFVCAIIGSKVKKVRVFPMSKTTSDNVILNLWVCNDTKSTYVPLVKSEEEMQFQRKGSWESFIVYKNKGDIEVFLEKLNGGMEENIDLKHIWHGLRAKAVFSFKLPCVQSQDVIKLRTKQKSHNGVVKFLIQLEELHQCVLQTTSEGKRAQQQKKLELDSTDFTLQFLSKNLGKEWRTVCRGLKVKTSEMEQLERDYMNNTQEVIFQSLLKWKRREASAATFGILSDALRAEDRGDLAEAVLGYADLFSEGD